jgi:hypothetical protein
MTLSPIGKVLRWSGASLARHGVLYGVLAVAAIALSWAIVAGSRLPEPLAITLAGSTVAPVFTCIINAYSFADWTGETGTAAVWARVLDRVWAVIIIDFINTVLVTYAQAGIGGDPIVLLIGIPLLILAAAAAFADVAAVVDERTPWWGLAFVPFVTSIATVFSRGLFTRAMSLLVLQLLIGYASDLIHLWLDSAKIGHAVFWALIPMGMITLPGVQALLAFTYLDAATDESKRPCSE